LFANILEKLKKNNIEYLQLRFVDNSGILRTKVILKNKFEQALKKGTNFSKAIMNFTAQDKYLDTASYNAAAGDFWAIPDLDSLKFDGYEKDTAIVYCNLFNADNTPFINCHRSLLKNMIKKTEENWQGKIMAAFEPEFIILDPQKKEPLCKNQLFSISNIKYFKKIFDEIIVSARKMNIPLIQISSESSLSQFELNIGKQTLLKACDDWVTLKNMLKNIAADNNYLISFLPKPFNNIAGNGLHLHLSINNEDQNLLLTKDKSNHYLQKKTRSFIAGLLKHGKALTALGAASVNSYKRFQPNSWAPTHLNWGIDNRNTFIRVTEPRDNRHLEIRFADASSNPYLFTAALLAAGLLGVNNELSLMPASTDNSQNNDYQTLPSHLGEAIDNLKKDQDLQKLLRKELITEYVKVKEKEWKSYLAEVNSWDTQFIDIY